MVQKYISGQGSSPFAKNEACRVHLFKMKEAEMSWQKWSHSLAVLLI